MGSRCAGRDIYPRRLAAKGDSKMALIIQSCCSTTKCRNVHRGWILMQGALYWLTLWDINKNGTLFSLRNTKIICFEKNLCIGTERSGEYKQC